ncbi:MAG: SMI1/KNR4 family protein [Chlamydiae bacterium CG10_big_fil_rev_8_21_14_0_10_42_34]|nr:MAG: SMI1/KNR4 family protein [Chlamydiae bacterium CG10_big_fil_rev_8_21_14_0_10_42_34]
MNSLVREFFTTNENDRFKEVRFLNEEPDITWDQISKVAYDLPRGWFELSRVSPQDRVEFTRDFWLDRIPYHPKAHPAFFEFFERLDDIGVVLVRRREGEPLDAELIYSLADGSTFFRGKPPCTDSEVLELKEEMEANLPRDFLSFLKIHNGFGKLSEMGFIEAEEISHAKRRVMDLMLRTEKRVKSGDIDVDPGSLIPFYEALGLSSFQCFYADWYPGNEMGNVYLSGIDYTLSDVNDKKTWVEHLAFPTFSEWLAYYLQGMDLCT